ncbi:MAG TPA: extracellular solute-binding protein [Chloroflexota bacterium]|nr:extracellular solute-binding protein [Chloroflexota bacterium]
MTDEGTHETQTLRLISREFEGFEKAFALQAEAFSRNRPDLRVACEFIEIGQLYETMVAGGGAAGAVHDLFLCVTDWLPEAISKDLLEPLDGYLAADPPPGWPDAWAPSMRGLQRGPDGKTYGLPYHDGPEVLMYRTDLFGDPGEQARFRREHGRDLAPPETWAQFLEVAQFFTRPDEGLYGTCVAAYPDGHNNVYDFLIHLWSRGGALFDAAWRPRFHDAPGQDALRFYADLFHTYKVVSPECLALDSVKCGFHYAAGKAAMMWNWCGFAAVAEVPHFSQIVGRNACALVPRGDGPGGRHTSLNIFWVLAIPSGSARKEQAYAFLKHVAGAEMDKVTSMAGGNGTRLSTWRDPEVQATYSYYRIIERVHEAVHSPPSIPEYPAVNEVLSQMVDSVVTGRREVPQALHDAAQATEQIMAEAGYYR